MTQRNLLEVSGTFQHFFENHPDSMFVIDADNRVVAANAAAVVTFEYTLDELLETTWLELLNRSDPAPCNFFRELNSKDRPEVAIRHKLGHFVYVRVTCMPLVSNGQEIGKLISLEDFSEQREQRKDLSGIQEMLVFITEKSQNIISSLSADGVFTYISPNVEALLGYSPSEVIGQPSAIFNHPETNAELLQYRTRLNDVQETERFTGRLRHKNGEYRWYETTVQYIRDATGQVLQTIGVGRDITDRKEAEEKIAYLAYHDILTGLPNRRLFTQHMNHAIAKPAGALHSLMLLDLDEFKYVNDTFGHEVGDLLLVEIAKRLSLVVGNAGFVARLGGDEFTILHESPQSRVDSDCLRKRIEAVIAEPVMIGDSRIHMHASIGIAWFPEDGDSVEALMKCADRSMYAAKQRKNQV